MIKCHIPKSHIYIFLEDTLSERKATQRHMIISDHARYFFCDILLYRYVFACTPAWYSDSQCTTWLVYFLERESKSRKYRIDSLFIDFHPRLHIDKIIFYIDVDIIDLRSIQIARSTAYM